MSRFDRLQQVIDLRRKPRPSLAETIGRGLFLAVLLSRWTDHWIGAESCEANDCAACRRRYAQPREEWGDFEVHDWEPQACTCGLDALRELYS